MKLTYEVSRSYPHSQRHRLSSNQGRHCIPACQTDYDRKAGTAQCLVGLLVLGTAHPWEVEI